MTDRNNLASFAITVYNFMEFEVKNYKKQVENGEISKEWLDGYIRGLDEYKKALVDNAMLSK